MGIGPRSASRWLAGVVAAIGLVGSACGDDSDDPGPGATGTTEVRPTTAPPPTGDATGSTSPAPPYLLIDADGWELVEAVAPPSEDPLDAPERPPLAWYAEYRRSDRGTSADLRISAHHGDLAWTRDHLSIGFGFEERAIADRRALVGDSRDPAGPALVLLEQTPTITVQLLSYELGTDDVVDLAARLRPVDEAGWVAAGGTVG